LRKEVQGLQEVKDLKVTRDSYSIIDSLAKGRQKDGTLTGAGDMSLIFAYMKMLDPNSTVREGEFANAQNAGGVASTIQNTYNKILKGNRLTADQVETFKNEAKTLYHSKLRQVQPTIDYYKQLAEKRNFDPAEVIPDFSFKDGGSVGNSWTDPTSGITYTISN